MPLYTADALVLRTYKLGEADRIVVFLTRDRGKKRGVAKGARRPRSKFMGALEPLTEVHVEYFEKRAARAGGAELRGDHPLADEPGIRCRPRPVSKLDAADTRPEALGYVGYFAEPLDEWAAGRRCRRAALPARARPCSKRWARVRPWSRWRATSSIGSCGCRASTRKSRGTLSPEAAGISRRGPRRAAAGAWPRGGAAPALKELESAHRALIAMHLEKHVKSDRVLRDLRRHA